MDKENRVLTFASATMHGAKVSSSGHELPLHKVGIITAYHEHGEGV